jgi:hypothetical protein
VHFHAKQNTSWQQGGVIYFLFLVNDNLPHVALWKKFFASAPVNTWKALVHCKDPAGCTRNGLFSNAEFFQVDTVPTWYCHDLVTAMAHLAKIALQNPPQPGEREKFVFLSESTLPVKPFNEIHTALMSDDDSDMCLFPVNQWGSSNIDGAYVQLAKHHQWVVLSRSHADLFVKNWVPVNAQSHWHVWVKTGTWEAAPKFVLPQNFYYPSPGTTCADEWAMMATIFGALEPQGGFRLLTGFGGGQINMNSHLMQGRCRTWTFWDHSWDLEASALANQIAGDVYGSGLTCYPKCWTRPAELYKLSSQSLQALRTSPFLFARKFSSTVWMPDFERIIIR